MTNKLISKKTIIAIALIAVMICCLWLLTPERAFAASSKKLDALSYKMTLTLDTKSNSLSEIVTIKFKNNTDSTVRKIYLRDMTPAVLKYDMKNYSEDNKDLKTKITSVTLKGSTKKLGLTYKKGRSAVLVDLGTSGQVKPGATGTIKVKLKTDIPNRADRFGYQKTKKGKLYALSFCFPYLADNLNGSWQLDPFFDDGESRSWDLADYNVTFKAPKSYKVAATGTSTTTDGKTTIKADDVRDFAIVACNFMAKDSFTVKGIKVNNYYLDGKYKTKYRKATKLISKDAIKVYTEQIGAYPYDELDVVPCLFGFGFGGMEYPGLIMTNGSSTFSGSLPDYWSLSDGLSHEIGHQWFYAAVGNREYREGWIDEGFTTYLERQIYGLYNGEAYKYIRQIDDMFPSIKSNKASRDELLKTARKDYKNIYLNVAPNKYPKGQEYGVAEYEASYMFLQELRVSMGDEKFGQFLKDFYAKYKMKRVTTKTVVNFIKKYDNSKKTQGIIDFYIKK